jgi:hypothetical protein
MPELSWRYQNLDWSEINLDFSGSRPATHPVHRHIAALSVGSPLALEEHAGRWELHDTQGAIVGKLSAKFSPPQQMHCIAARVAAIHVRHLAKVGEEHKARISEANSSWEMVVPELVFAPNNAQ